MKILLINYELISRDAKEVVLERFVNYLSSKPADALCIACKSNQENEAIERFKKQNKKCVPLIVESNASLVVYSDTLAVLENGILIGDKFIQSAVNAACVIEIKRDGTYHYDYVPFDLFMDNNLIPQIKGFPININLEAFKNLIPDGKPVVIPLQKFIEIIEDNIDEDAKEKIKKAKQEFHAKTKS